MSTPPFLDLPETAVARRVATPRGEFACLEARPPEGAPVRGTAVFLPGFTGAKEDFVALLDPLARRGYRVVAYDQRGQYQSPGDRAEQAAYARGEFVFDLWALSDVVAQGEAFHLVGHSFGGLVARSAALDGPDFLASLTLMSTGPAAIQEPEVVRLKALERALAGLSLREVWDAMRAMDSESGVCPPSDPRIATYLRDRWLGNSPAQLMAVARQLRTEPDLTEELAEWVAWGMRTLVLSGERDYAWPVDWQAETARRLGVRHVVVAGAGHSPNAEAPEATARELADFWDAVRAEGPRVGGGAGAARPVDD